jgi:putative phosphoserine phosphatase/1-acylglycerol-3-phosphate O-acyltransferase
VKEFASENGVDLERSFAYANGDEDVAFLETVGNPRPLNPQKGLARVANEAGWPASQLAGRGRPGVMDVVRTAAALTGLGAAGGFGAAIGLLTGDRS